MKRFAPYRSIASRSHSKDAQLDDSAATEDVESIEIHQTRATMKTPTQDDQAVIRQGEWKTAKSAIFEIARQPKDTMETSNMVAREVKTALTILSRQQTEFRVQNQKLFDRHQSIDQQAQSSQSN